VRQELKERGIVRSHHQVTRVTIDDRWRQLSVRMHSAVHAVTDSHEIRCKTYSYILAFINRTSFIDGSYHNCAVVAITNLHKLNIRIDVDVRVFASLDPHILILEGRLLNGDTLIEPVHVYDLPLGFMRGYDLAKPVDNHIYMHFDGVAARLKEGRESGKLYGAPSGGHFQTAGLLHLE